jgi:hypothetical protein
VRGLCVGGLWVGWGGDIVRVHRGGKVIVGCSGSTTLGALGIAVEILFCIVLLLLLLFQGLGVACGCLGCLALLICDIVFLLVMLVCTLLFLVCLQKRLERRSPTLWRCSFAPKGNAQILKLL